MVKRSMWVLPMLYFKMNRNHFFEKYPFLSKGKPEALVSWLYRIWFVFRNYGVVLGLGIIGWGANAPMLAVVMALGYLATLLLKVGTDKWHLFKRHDMVLAVPDRNQRFWLLVVGDMVWTLLLENSALLVLAYLGYALRWGWMLSLLFSVAYLSFYVGLMAFYCVIIHCKGGVKTLISFLSYLSSVLVTMVVFYGIGDFMVVVVKDYGMHFRDHNIFEIMIRVGQQRLIQVLGVMMDGYGFVVGGIVLFSGMALVGVAWVFKENERVQNEKTIGRVYLWMLARGAWLVDVISFKSELARVLVKKEIALFKGLYPYNFREYGYVLIADRPLFVLMGLFGVVLRHNFEGSYQVVFAFAPFLFLITVASEVGMKLIANLSFVADYNTLLMFNGLAKPLAILGDAKLTFYHMMTWRSHALFVLVVNGMLWFLGASWLVNAVMSGLLVGTLLLAPRIFYTNNLLHCRMDFRDFQAYLESSQLLSQGTEEGFVINVLVRVWFGLGLLSFVVVKFVSFEVLCVVSVFVQGLLLGGVWLVMRSVGRNILGYIEKGQYALTIEKGLKR